MRAADASAVRLRAPPRRAGAHGELIAAILDMVVLPEGFPVDWLGRDQLAGR